MGLRERDWHTAIELSRPPACGWVCIKQLQAMKRCACGLISQELLFSLCSVLLANYSTVEKCCLIPVRDEEKEAVCHGDSPLVAQNSFRTVLLDVLRVELVRIPDRAAFVLLFS